MIIYKVNGVAMPTPFSYKVTASDLDSEKSGRSASGYISRQVLRKGTRKIEIGYEDISHEDVQKLSNALYPDFVTVEYYDPHTPAGSNLLNKTIKAYASDRNAELSKKIDTNNIGQTKWNYSFSLIEQ